MSTVVSEGRNGGNERYSPQDDVSKELPDINGLSLEDTMGIPSFDRLPRKYRNRQCSYTNYYENLFYSDF
ncbi:hypothetical protein B9Z55_002537 [Caenorhabditis nigoni]|uniref:Uncharacterized protein n=1 Tax=Caenorhabditis nigoni TaxID=1611254 RepID=A0A2G5VL43_9PELO|nr:hypothetical protein B9Z55_002537 [Caenorhabditis nigoni]